MSIVLDLKLDWVVCFLLACSVLRHQQWMQQSIKRQNTAVSLVNATSDSQLEHMPPLTLAQALLRPRVAAALRDNPGNFRFPEAPELVVTAAPWVPHVMVVNHADGGRSLQGPCAKTIDIIAEAINFTYTVVQPPDGEWGLVQGNGSWSGMIGQVVRKEADVGIGPFAMTYSRSTAISFTVPILQDYFRILVSSGHPEPDPWGFLKPLSIVTWIGILLSGLLICSALLFVVQVYRTRVGVQQNVALWVRYFFKLFGVIVSQDFKVLVVEGAVYALVGAWLIFCLVVMRSFSGALTSQLSVRYVPAPVRNLGDLVRHPEMKVILETQTTFSDYVKTTKEGIFGELGAFYDQGRIKEVTSPEFPEAMLNEVSSGEYVLLIDELTLLRLLSMQFSKTGICSYYLADDRFKPWVLSFIGPKNHPLVPAISEKILSIVESGLYMRWVMEEIPNATSCNSQPSSISVSEPYGLRGLWGVFVLLACGLCISLLTFVCEVMNPRHKDLPLLNSHRIAQ